MRNLFKMKKLLYSLSILVCLLGVTTNAWANLDVNLNTPGSGTHYISATTADPAAGLVYMSKTNEANVPDSKFKNYQPGGSLSGKDNTNCYVSNGSHGCTPTNMFFWARPSRGYEFNGSWGTRGTDYAATPSSKGIVLSEGKPTSCDDTEPINLGPFDGSDIIQTTAGGQADTHMRPKAGFRKIDPFWVTYVIPAGGAYQVHYSYTKSYDTGEPEPGDITVWKFHEETEDYELSTSTEENQIVESYNADGITLSSENSNFRGWYKNGELMSSTNPYSAYKANANATIMALFKVASLGEPEGDISPVVSAGKTSELTPFNGTVTVPVSAYSTWATGDFEVVFTEKTSRGDVTKGTTAYVKLSGDDLGSTGTLTIPFTFNPSSFGGTEVEVTVTPEYGEARTFTILASANKEVNYEACILLGDEDEPQDENTGTLLEMVALANTMDSNPKVQLAKNCTITSPLSLTKSMVFDLNDKTLISTGTSAFSIAAQGIDVQIVDNGFSRLGTIATSSSQSGNVNVVTFAQKAKLTMQGGTLSATNTGSGSAYGINVTHGSIFYMTDGQLTVTGTSEARGVNVATANDYATFNGGRLTVSAPSNAYGLWSAGQSNITNATISVEATTGANAYGAYINGGVSTLTTNTISVEAQTTNAYGAYVKAGRLNGNGGSFVATAVTDKVYGVYVASGATAMLQQKATVNATITTGNGNNNVEVCGVNNLGTISLNNISVTATSATNYATAVNTVTSATSTTIEGGNYVAQTAIGNAYGLHHQSGSLTIDGGTFRAIGGGDNIYGGRAVADATIAYATLHGETQGSGKIAYGFVGGESVTVSLDNCTLEGISNTKKAYAIVTRSNLTATNCTLTATTKGAEEVYGIFVRAGSAHLNNCVATVTSYTTMAYGVNHEAGNLTIEGGEYDVVVNQTTAPNAEDSKAYGLYGAAGKTATVANAVFDVKSSNAAYSQNVYGALINGTLNSTGATYKAEGKLNVYGVWGNTASTLNLSGNTISTRATNGTASYGIYAKKNFTIDGDVVSAVGTTTGVYAMFFDASTSNGDVLGGKFSAQTNANNGYGALNDKGTAGNVELKGGVYKTTINLQKYTSIGYQIYHLDETHPDYAEGYRYIIAKENPSPYVCRIVNGAHYATLEEALQYTQDHSGTFTIVMTQSYTLPAGDYVLPANATLIVPRKFGQTTITENGNPAVADKITTVDLNENFLCLTLASNAHINVDGKIGVSGEMYCTQSGGVSNQSPYGRIHMESASHIQLNSGAYLYAWGMITGAGSITVKSNAEVREMFQVKNMPSASNLRYYIKQTNSSNTTGFMPFNQYSIQNIEVPTTYYHNSRLMTEMRCYYQGADFWYGDGNIKLVGTSDALFEVTSDDESSWVCKSYDATNKQQVWKVNSSAQLGSISITMKLPIVNQTVTVNSADYILPITNTMKIHVLDGDFAITNETELMPGSSVEINKTASLTVNSGKNVYVFDQHQWTSTSYPDAAINVHGNINVAGALYTTKSIASGTNATNGANIYSNNADAGTIFFENAAPSVTTEIDLITGIENNAIKTRTVTMDPAQLKNGTGASQAYTATSETAASHSFAYMNNEWTPTYTNGCFEVVGEKVYAKPSGYVQLKKTAMGDDGLEGVEEDDHTYLTIDDKLLILMIGCQWWEVEATSDPSVFECKKPGYEGFYYYDNFDEIWKLKTVNVKFYSKEEGEGDAVLHTVVTDFNGRPDPSVIPSNPTKATTTGFTYQFYGWKSSETGTTYKWTDPLEVATSDMSYRPVFTETKRNYTITLVNANNGANVPLEVPYGDTPEYTPKKDPTAQYTYTFDHWAPTFSAVTGAATYTAYWNSVVNNYDIIWKNGDEVLETDENQPYGTATAYNGATPTKEMDDQYEYTFSKWKSSLNGNLYNNGSTPSVAGETTYEAQYTTTPRYVITFNNYDGTQLARIIYTQGGMPVYEGVPTRKRDADGYFRFIGWKNSDGDDYAANETLPSVTKKETYTAQYDYVTDLFTITLQNVDGNGASWSGKFGEGSTPFYDPNNDDVPNVPEKAGDAQYSYSFAGWDPALVPVEGEATYTAQFEQHVNTYYITFANVDGKGAQQQLEYDYGETPEYSGVVSMYSDGTHLYSFRAWKRTSNQQEYTILPTVVGNETYTAQYDVVENLDVNDDITVDENTSLGSTTVHVSGKLNVADGVTLTTTNLILEASGDASGQILDGAGTIDAANVYYDLKLNTDARHWHAFGVPWAVDINTNPLVEVETGRTLNISRDYEIMYYDGAERATNGPSAACWKYLRHYDEAGQPVEVLQPGRGYMIAFGSHVNTVRFVKKSDAPIIYTGSVGVTAHQIGAISNPMAYHTTMDAGVGVGQVHDGGEIGHDGYDEVTISAKRFVVGKTVYIDPQSTQSVVISKAEGSVSPVAAPARRGAKAMNKKYLTLEDYYTVALINANGEERKVYVLPEEDKEDKYVVGHDLAKMGMSDRKAQIWVNRYEVNLGLNTTAPMDGVAEFPVNIYAPKAGEYTVSLVSEPDEEYTVYLTLNGEAIWNLSSSEYAVELAAGTNKSYGLRLVANKAPQTATGIDEAVVDAQGEIKKVIINDKVFIIRGDQVYSIDGRLAK